MGLKKYSILVVDDDQDMLTAVRLLLKTEVKEVVIEKKPEQLPHLISTGNFDLVLLDMNFNSAINTGNEGLFWLKKIKELKPSLAVVMMTAYADIDLAVRCLKEGAADFVVKPWHNQKLLETLEEALKKTGNKHPLKQDPTGKATEIIGDCPLMQEVFYKTDKVAPTDANILLLGENGTGKDLIAHAIHQRSLRAGKPFVKVDLGALTDTLFESELFGYKKGAFTDAREDRPGRFELADGGTLFLDEIGNISLHQQTKLLSALQNRQITRLGASQPVPVNIRLVCATNLPVAALADESRFRKDLIYRINTVEITIPPLRKRAGDIGLLAHHFVKVYAAKYFKQEISLGPKALAKLSQYPFPGNVRELQYVVERAVIMAEENVLQEEDIIFSTIAVPADQPGEADDFRLSDMEKKTILRAIEKQNGNISGAARELGITRTALYRRLTKYGI